MASLKKGDIETALQTKGFHPVTTDHNHFIFYTNEGKKTAVRTKTSHGNTGSSISDSLIGVMARQCKLTKMNFFDLVNCPLSRASYEELLAQGGHI